LSAEPQERKAVDYRGEEGRMRGSVLRGIDLIGEIRLARSEQSSGSRRLSETHAAPKRKRRRFSGSYSDSRTSGVAGLALQTFSGRFELNIVE